MNSTEKALLIVVTPIKTGKELRLHPIVLLEEAIRGIVEEAPRRGLAEAAPGIEGLAHLTRVLVAAAVHSTTENVAGFLRLQLMRIESLMQEHPGDPASACQHLGLVFARALELMGRADDETYPVPRIFRSEHQPAP
ncbi:TPA: hypothetical protein DIV48_00930 [Candidatus Kaiserbacteria bacterium]|nr:MAG: hypothetical protein UY93_C0003G0005 [Parcubacteria group bacterium GW2011_GWA1_56_13]HCR52195.1 hypothetical protein [Candidatus Kaiserbacteria bacterium]